MNEALIKSGLFSFSFPSRCDFGCDFQFTSTPTGALGVGGEFFASALKPLIPSENFVKRSVVISAANTKNLVAVDFVPPSAGSFHPYMTNEFVG